MTSLNRLPNLSGPSEEQALLIAKTRIRAHMARDTAAGELGKAVNVTRSGVAEAFVGDGFLGHWFTSARALPSRRRDHGISADSQLLDARSICGLGATLHVPDRVCGRRLRMARGVIRVYRGQRAGRWACALW